TLKMPQHEAEEMLDTIDNERALFVRKYYNAEWPCRKLYHLMLNSDTGIDFVTETILHAIDRIEAAASVVTHHPAGDETLHSKTV
ncbi:MAG: cytidylate kinase family protein, partial [Candidatus Korobacteraceae bacterium]